MTNISKRIELTARGSGNSYFFAIINRNRIIGYLKGLREVNFWLPKNDGTPLVLKSILNWSRDLSFKFTDCPDKFKQWMEDEGGGIPWSWQNPHKYKAEFVPNDDGLPYIVVIKIKK